MRKIFSILLSVCILLSGILVSAQEPTYHDTQSHWAKDAITVWSEYGIINGYDGNFLPDKNITRGDFATVLNRIFQFQNPGENLFRDLGESYYTEPILCLYKEGIMTGYEQFIRPTDYITREEAGVMLAKALKLTVTASFDKPFLDEDKIGDWSKPY
ncbi:MAG: S-layer homology domain-containing protein, partial [Clostridia bacterium]|nr:S-layer homology domain-containing protein [Clostridia bacterium]